MRKAKSIMLFGAVAVSVVVSVSLIASSSVFAAGWRGGERHRDGAMSEIGRQDSDFWSGNFQKSSMPCIGSGTTQSWALCWHGDGKYATWARIPKFMSGGLHYPPKDCSGSGTFESQCHKFGSGALTGSGRKFPQFQSGALAGSGKHLQKSQSGTLTGSKKHLQKSQSGTLTGSKKHLQKNQSGTLTGSKKHLQKSQSGALNHWEIKMKK